MGNVTTKRPEPKTKSLRGQRVMNHWETDRKHRFDGNVADISPPRPFRDFKESELPTAEPCSWYDLPCLIADAVKQLVDYEKTCLKEIIVYIGEKIKGNSPLAPSIDCWIMGGMIIVTIIFAVGGTLYFGSDIIKFVVGIPINMVKSLFSADVAIAQYFQIAFSNVAYLARTVTGFLVDMTTYMAELTNSDMRLWLLLLGTFLVYLATQLGIELADADSEWIGSLFYDVFKVIDWPFEWVAEQIKKATGNGVLYWISRIILFPFQIGTFGVSFIIGGMLYILRELYEQLTENKA